LEKAFLNSGKAFLFDATSSAAIIFRAESHLFMQARRRFFTQRKNYVFPLKT
jgi:hypothetical protein